MTDNKSCINVATVLVVNQDNIGFENWDLKLNMIHDKLLQVDLSA